MKRIAWNIQLIYEINWKYDDIKHLVCCIHSYIVTTVCAYIPVSSYAVPPSVEATIDSITAVQGDTLTLSCVAAGIPTPTIDWYVTQL